MIQNKNLVKLILEMTIRLFISKLLVFSIFFSALTWSETLSKSLKNNLSFHFLENVEQEVESHETQKSENESPEGEMNFLNPKRSDFNHNLYSFFSASYLSIIHLKSQNSISPEIKPPSKNS